MSSRCFFCNRENVLRYSGDCETLWDYKNKTYVFVCFDCIKKLPKYKQERYYKEKYKEYTKKWDIYLREVKCEKYAMRKM